MSTLRERAARLVKGKAVWRMPIQSKIAQAAKNRVPSQEFWKIVKEAIQ